MGDGRLRFANEKHEYHDPRLLLGCWFDERARREVSKAKKIKIMVWNIFSTKCFAEKSLS